VSPFSPGIHEDANLSAARELAPISMLSTGQWFLYVPRLCGKNLRSSRPMPGPTGFASPLPRPPSIDDGPGAKTPGIHLRKHSLQADGQSSRRSFGATRSFPFTQAGGATATRHGWKTPADFVLSRKRTTRRIRDVSHRQGTGLDLETYAVLGFWAPWARPRTR